VVEQLRNLGAFLSFIILDSCRGDGTIGRVPQDPESFDGIYYALAASPYAKAMVHEQSFSYFTNAFLQALFKERPGTRYADTFKEVKRLVWDDTKNAQLPNVFGDTRVQFCFRNVPDNTHNSNSVEKSAAPALEVPSDFIEIPASLEDSDDIEMPALPSSSSSTVLSSEPSNGNDE